MQQIEATKGHDWTTIRQLAQAASCTVQGVHKAIKAGNITGWQRIGFIYVIPITEANRWIKERKERWDTKK